MATGRFFNEVARGGGAPPIVRPPELDVSNFTEILYSDPAYTWTPGGSGSYTTEEVTHPIYGTGIKLTTGTGTTDFAWVDVSAASLGFWSNKDVFSVMVSDCDGNGTAIFSRRFKDNAADLSTGTSNWNDTLPSFAGERLITGRLDTDTFTGSFDGSIAAGITIKGFRLRIGNNGVGESNTISIYGILKNKCARKGTVILDFDDGWLSQYSEAWQYMRSKGIVGNVAVIAASVGTAGFVTLDKLKAMYESGWSMIVHGDFPHEATLVSYANIYADVLANQAYVQTNFDYDGAAHYVLPAGDESPLHTSNVLTALGFVTSRTTEKVNLPAYPTSNNSSIGSSFYHIPSVQGSAFVSLATLKKYYDRAKQAGIGVRFQFHRIVSSLTADTQNEILTSDFQAFIDYIAADVASNVVWNPTVPQWYAAHLAAEQ